MNKLKLFIGVGICGILFTGCGFFGIGEVDCRPQDLKDRLAGYGWTATDKWKEYFVAFEDFEGTEVMSNNRCDNWAIEHYKDIVSKEKTLPTNIKEENKLATKWQSCNMMPEWLETKLDEYISQNKNDDKAFIEASKFKESWRPKPTYKKFSSEEFDYDKYRLNGKLEYTYYKGYNGTYYTRKEMGMPCKFTKIAIKAIENDLFDLSGGKKAKCADLSYKDAWLCQSHFDSVYKKAKADYELKQQRIEYEKKNRQ